MKKNPKIVAQVPGLKRFLVVAILPGILSGIILIIQAYYLSHIINSVFLGGQTLLQVWHSMLILLVMAPLLPSLMAIVGIMAGAETRRRWQTLRLLSAHFLDVLQGLTTLKLFGRSEAEEEQIRNVSERFRRTTMSALRIAFFSSF